MVLKWGDTWAVKKNMLRKKRRTGSRREPAGCKRRRTGGLERGYVERKKSSDESNEWNFPSLQKAADIWPTHLSRSSFEVLFQHAQLHDITRVPDDCHYGNRVTALDVAVETLHTVETERTRHPQPRLQKQHSKNQAYGIDNESSFTKTALCHVCCSPEFIFFAMSLCYKISAVTLVWPQHCHIKGKIWKINDLIAHVAHDPSQFLVTETSGLQKEKVLLVPTLFGLFVDNGSHCGSLDSQNLRNCFVILSRLKDISDFAVYLEILKIMTWCVIF